MGNGEYALMFQGRQVGGYRVEGGVYRPLEGDRWGEPCDPPCQLPEPPQARRGEACVIEQDGTKNFGIDTRKLEQGKHYLNGKEVSKQVMLDAIKAASIPQDSKLLRLTIAGGSDAARQQIRRDLDTNPQLLPFKSKMLVQDYPAGHWALACGFAANVQEPGVYVQAPDGTVLHHQADYNDGPEGLAHALREVDANYNPAADPDQRSLNAQSIPTWGWVLGGLAVFVLLSKGKE